MSKIEWTDITWNPVTGCSKISPGCANCYAERMAKRLAGRCGYDAKEPFKVTLHKERLDDPLRWQKPRRVFVCSMGDLFHSDVPYPVILAIFARMVGPSQLKHTFQILTKRPERMLEFFKWMESPERTYRVELTDNIWIGVTAENQEMADKRIPLLLQVPAKVRFVSVEPMLGPVDFDLIPEFDLPGNEAHGTVSHYDAPWEEYLSWVICGGETGPGHRPIDLSWARNLRDQCRNSGIPFFFKKVGGMNSLSMAKTPADLQIQESPIWLS